MIWVLWRSRSLAEGMNIVGFSLFDPAGTTVWSTDLQKIGKVSENISQAREATYRGVTSEFRPDQEFVDLRGVYRHIDVVETFLPLRTLPSGHVIGVIGIHQQIPRSLGIQVDQTRSAARWVTVITMSFLFVILLGFVAVADTALHRTRVRELSVVKTVNRTLEA